MKEKTLLIFILIIFSLLPLKELLKPGAYWSHDLIEHAARLASFYESLRQGNLIPRWGGNLNYNYGHPVLMFLYPLTNYLGSLIHFLGFNIIDSIKILFGLSYLLSGLFMFLWIDELWNRKAGFMAAVFYLFAPYRFVDLYVRAALGEHLAFTFIPLTCWFLTKAVKETKVKYFGCAALSLTMLLLAHNAVSLMFIPFILLYGVWLLAGKKGKKRLLILFFLSLVLGLMLSAFYWLPAFIEGKYTLREVVTTREVFANNYLKWQELFFSKWGYGYSSYKAQPSGFLVSLSWFQWLAFVLAFIFSFFKKNKEKTLGWLLILYLTAGLFLSINLSAPFLKFLPLIYRFQFPWRFLAVPVFISSVLAAYLTFLFKAKFKNLILIFITLLILLTTNNYWQTQAGDKNYTDEDLLQRYTSTTETGESTPRWALRFQENYPEKKVQLVSGGLDEVVMEKWDFEEHRYQIKVREDSQIADNTLYFPGWKVWVDNKEVEITFHDLNWRGIITYPVFQGEHQIMVKFTKTKVRQLAESISLVNFIFVLGFLIWPKRKRL